MLVAEKGRTPLETRHDHLTDHNWQLEIEGVTQGAAVPLVLSAKIGPTV